MSQMTDKFYRELVIVNEFCEGERRAKKARFMEIR